MATVFVGLLIKRMLATWSRQRVAMGGALLIVLLSLPGSFDFFVKSAHLQQPAPLPSDVGRMVRFAGKQAVPGTVVLSEDEALGRCLVAMVPMRSPFLDVYSWSFMSTAEATARRTDLLEFWTRWRQGDLNREVVDRYTIDAIVSLTPAPGIAPAFRSGRFYWYEIAQLVQAM